MLGGTGPESTIDYYRLILEEHARRRPDQGNPPILINSVNFRELMPFMESHDWEGLARWLAAQFEILGRAGADFGLISANTPHVAYELLELISPLPLLSILSSTAEEASRRGFRRLALLGTRLTMEGRFYPDEFERRGMELVVPREAELEFVNRKYFDELFVGIFKEETRESFRALILDMVHRDSVDAVVLGGTELPLLLRQVDDLPVPLLDTAKIHASAAVDRILS